MQILVDSLSKRQYNKHLNSKIGNTMQTTYTTKNGGTVTITPTGLIHKAGSAYTGKIAASEAAQKPAKK